MALLINSQKLEKMFSELDIIENSDIDTLCHICKEKHDKNSCKLPCGHSYHYNCIRESQKNCFDKSNKNTCPLCNTPFGTLTSIKSNKLYPETKKQRKKKTTTNIPKCNGLTKKGLPCKNHGKHNGYCHLHIPEKL